MTDTREYNSPLREEQARRTRIQILEALVDLVSEEGPTELSIRDLANRAGVSQRTVYRHFPDRQALLDGLVEHVGAMADWSNLTALAGGVRALPAELKRAWASFDAFDRETRTMVMLNRDPARRARESVERGDAINVGVADEFPHLSAEDSRGVAGLIRLLASSQTWHRFTREFGMSSDQGAVYVSWVLGLIARELDAGNTPTPFD